MLAKKGIGKYKKHYNFYSENSKIPTILSTNSYCREVPKSPKL